MRVGALILVMLAGLTALRVPDWRSDLTLWSAAVRVTPDSPRPAVNLAAAYLSRQDYEMAALWSVRARALAAGRPPRERDAVARITTNQLRWIDLFHPVCTRPTFASAC